MIIKTIHDAGTEEILRIMRTYESKAQVHPNENMLPLQLAMFAELLESVRKTQRVLNFKAGNAFENQEHLGEVVLTPKGGMGG